MGVKKYEKKSQKMGRGIVCIHIIFADGSLQWLQELEDACGMEVEWDRFIKTEILRSQPDWQVIQNHYQKELQSSS